MFFFFSTHYVLGITKNICSFLKQFQLHQGFRLTYEVVQQVIGDYLSRDFPFFLGGGGGAIFQNSLSN